MIIPDLIVPSRQLRRHKSYYLLPALLCLNQLYRPTVTSTLNILGFLIKKKKNTLNQKQVPNPNPIPASALGEMVVHTECYNLLLALESLNIHRRLWDHNPVVVLLLLGVAQSGQGARPPALLA